MNTPALLRERLRHTLCAWPFLLSLAMLLLNDWLLKRLWPGLLTGKLSDFAGVFLLALLLLAVWPTRRWLVYAAMAVGFAWWKSETSAGFIQWVQSLGLGWFGRTVDLTDLWALLVLPLSGWVAARTLRFAIAPTTYRRWIAGPAAAVTSLALMGTSQAPRMAHEFVLQDTTRTGQLHEARALAIVDALAQAYGLNCADCAQAYEQAEYTGPGVTLRYRFADANTWVLTISAQAGGILSLEKSPYQVADALEAQIKAAISAAHPGVTHEVRAVQLNDDRWPR